MPYVSPVPGGPAMPTIGALIQRRRRGFAGPPSRSSDATVYGIVEGRGRTRIGDSFFDWQPKDVFVVPSWSRVSHAAQDDSVLFSFSDRPMQQALGLWRESVEQR